jgi:hypothetical protein
MGKTLSDVFGNWQAHDVESRNAKTPCGADLNRNKNLGAVSSVESGHAPEQAKTARAEQDTRETNGRSPLVPENSAVNRQSERSASPGRPLLESDLHDEIMEFCKARGWLCVHSRTDKKTTTAKGVCDCIIVTPKIVAFVECKRKGNKPTLEQLAFLRHVQKMGWPNAVVYNMSEFLVFMDKWL